MKLKPFLHWAGGKRQLLPELKKYIPGKFNRYFEPFIGPGALFFELQPKNAIINDSNTELINLYEVIRDNPNDLLEDLNNGLYINTKERFLGIRECDRSVSYLEKSSSIDKAARTLYLNKTCFNGLYRLNSKGQFNSPYGYHKNDPDWEPELIWSISEYLNKSNVTIYNCDFPQATVDARQGDFVYCDPPYDPVSNTGNFTSYTSSGFTHDDQIRLVRITRELHNRGIKVMLSNSDTEFIRGIYSDPIFHIHEVTANRCINSNSEKRGKVGELIITTY